MLEYLKAPKGADTNLEPEQWAMVRTKNYKAWFGDWENDPENASKVLDENGEPTKDTVGKASMGEYERWKNGSLMQGIGVAREATQELGLRFSINDLTESIQVIEDIRQRRFGQSLTQEEAIQFVSALEIVSDGAPMEVDYNRESFDALFANGVITPEGKVKMGEGQFKKFKDLNRTHQLAYAYETLRNPDFITHKKSTAKGGQPAERDYSKIYGKVFTISFRDAESIVHYNSISVLIDGSEIVISNYAPNSIERFRRELKEGSLTYIKKVTLPSESGTSAQGDQRTTDAGSSFVSKDTNSSETSNASGVNLSVTPEQDAEYRRAYEAGDVAKAIEMLDAAAIAAGYGTKAFHGTEKGFNVFQADYRTGGNFFTPQEDAAKAYANAQSLGKGGVVMPVYLNLGKTFEIDAKENQWDEVPIEWEVDSQKDDYDEFFDSDSDAEKEALKHPDAVISSSGISDTTDIAKRAKSNGYDSVVIRNIYDPADNSYNSMQDDIVIFTPSRIKSAEPFTFDDNGNLIPLSERFNTESDDIRFRISGENATFAEEDANELVNDIANGVYRQISSQENSGNLATEMDSESDGEVLFRFIGEIGADRLDKTDGGRRILNLIEAKKYNTPESAEKIKRAYGWELDKDAKGNPVWKYEESDFGIKDLNIKDGANLSDVIDDEGLFAAYPELKNYTLAIEDSATSMRPTRRLRSKKVQRKKMLVLLLSMRSNISSRVRRVGQEEQMPRIRLSWIQSRTSSLISARI